MDMYRVFFRFKVKNIIDSQIDDLAVILNGNDLALGCKMLYSLREIELPVLYLHLFSEDIGTHAVHILQAHIQHSL